jgi:hypothetical protein
MIEPDAITEARRALGKRLAAYRRAAGYNQAEFAPLTGYGRSTIANVETGRQRVPRDFWQRCDTALDTGDVLADEADSIEAAERERRLQRAAAEQAQRAERACQQLVGLQRGGPTLIPTTPPGDQWPADLDQARRAAPALWTCDLSMSVVDDDHHTSVTAFRWLIAPQEPPVAQVPGHRRIGHGDVERIRAVRRHLKDIDNAHGGGAAFPMTTAFLRHEVAPLLGSSYGEATARLLLGATGELALDAGWMAYDAGDHLLARRYMTQALRLSHGADDRMFGGRVLCAMSHQALHLGQVPLAIDLARAARSGTQHLATPAVSAMLCAMEACGHAAAGDRAQCTRALLEAETALDRAGPGDENPPWVDFDEGGLWGHTARALLDLGDAVEAERYAEQLSCSAIPATAAPAPSATPSLPPPAFNEVLLTRPPPWE